MKSRYMITAVGIVLLAGCASNEPRNALEAEKLQQKVMDARNEKIDEHIDSLPKWVVSPPKPDGKGMYAVGTAESDQLQIAINKARLEAEFGLAKLYSQELSGSERIYSTENNGQPINRYQGIIDKLVSEVPVVGFSTEEQEIKAINGKYNVYVLLKLPYDEFNAVLKNRKNRETAQDMVEAFDELERRLDKRKADLMQLRKHEYDIASRQMDQRLELIEKSDKLQPSERDE